MGKTRQRTAEAAPIDFRENPKKTADAKIRLCVGNRCLGQKNEYFREWRYLSKKEKEFKAQLEAIDN